MSKRRFASSIAALFLAAPFLQAEMPAGGVFDAITREVRLVMERSRSAICRVEGEDEHGRLSATGFFIDEAGTFITSYTAATECEDLTIVAGEERLPARRLFADESTGIAILQAAVTEPAAFLKTAPATNLEIASPLIVIGFPMGQDLSPSFGIVAGFDMGAHGRWFATRHIRASIPVRQGQGGSPVLNTKGEVVGVLISVMPDGAVFALPIEAVQKALRDYRTYGKLRPGWFGADVRMTDAPEHGSTARIRNLRNPGPAHAGKLRPGDVLLQIGDWRVRNPEDVLNAAYYLTAGQPVKVRVSRMEKELELQITPADPPDGSRPVLQRQQPAFLGANGEPSQP